MLRRDGQIARTSRVTGYRHTRRKAGEAPSRKLAGKVTSLVTQRDDWQPSPEVEVMTLNPGCSSETEWPSVLYSSILYAMSMSRGLKIQSGSAARQPGRGMQLRE
jgi:hypothetical protein